MVVGITRDNVMAEARKNLGTPHIHQGRLPGVGLDCAGLLITVGKALGVIPSDFDFIDYPEKNDGSDLERVVRMFAVEIPINEALPGDIAIMMVAGNPQHCGFFTDIGIIHSRERVEEHRIDSKWGKRIVKAFRLKELVDV